MVIVMSKNAEQADIDSLLEEIRRYDVQAHISHGVECTVIGLVGDTYSVDREKLSMHSGVEKIMRVQEPFKQVNRKMHPENTVIDIHGVTIQQGGMTLMAGPCSVESREQILETAQSVKASGASILRGGAFKPRTSPYSFQGLKKQGLEFLREAREASGLPIMTEIISPKHIDMFDMLVDIIQIGARNMQNFDLLKEVGQLKKPILLKRGLSSTIEEWLMSAEYILSRGNANVILCERGIRTFETYTRNTLDLSAIPIVKKLTHLPVVVDPSHATGHAWMVESMAVAAAAAGADGIVVEVHNNPAKALSDGPQSLTYAQFERMSKKVQAVHSMVKTLNEEEL